MSKKIKNVSSTDLLSLKTQQDRIAANKAWLTPPVERVEVGLPSVDHNGIAIEHGGPEGPEPTRFGDWEKKGICIDF